MTRTQTGFQLDTTSQKFLLLLFAVLLAPLSFIGCGTSVAVQATSQTASSNPVSITVSSSSPTVQISQTAAFTATRSGSSATGGTWDVIGGSGNGTVSSNGVFQAPSSVPSPAAVYVCYTVNDSPFCGEITIVKPASVYPVIVQPAQTTVAAGSTDVFTATQNGLPATGGQWIVAGGSANGSIDLTGLYQAPAIVPNQLIVSVGYALPTGTVSTEITVVVAPPSIANVTPSKINKLSTPLQINGSNFQSDSTVTINSIPVVTTFIDSSHLSATAVLSSPINAAVSVMVVNPGTPSQDSNPFSLSTSFPSITVQPASLAGGPVSLTISGSSFSQGDVVFLGAQPLVTTVVSATKLTATGFLTPWTTGSVLVEVSSGDGLNPLAAVSVPITATPVTFDAAARFTTQAAFGPRPDLVMHIQQVGFDQFITEQFQQPAVTYPLANGAHTFVTAAISGNSLLRQRVALALQTFIVGTNEDFGPSSTFLEDKFENDASANFRQLLTDIASDPNIGNFLNLAKNDASTSPLKQPNQNFAREVMQLFSIGPQLLNDDGSLELDSNGDAIPSYDQNTVLALTRALTGWQEPTIVNPATVRFGIDFSQPLNPNDAYHDHSAKLLFGTVSLPAGQSITQDRDMALDAIFNHPNVPPFVSHLLIQQLVTSNPSPQYIQRIAAVFEDDGTGTRGNMAAVIRAILLDPEARLGDTTPSPNDGFLQSPFKFQLFVMSALQDPGSDDQVLYTAQKLGENWWYSPTVFYFFSPSNMVPGTSIHSPEFMLFNNLSLIQRSQILWGIVSSTLPGYTSNYLSSSWLFSNFTTVPAMVDALNHLLYHGQMSTTEQTSIVNYCSQLDQYNINLQMESAIFLALNADSFNVSH